jgi:hypothetical protein
MRTSAVISAVLCAITTNAIAAGAQASAACPAVTDAREIPAALDSAISGRADKDPACLRALFLAEGRFVPVSTGPDGKPAPRVLSVDEYIERKANLGEEILEERQVKYSISEFGNVAHLWSTYVVKGNGKQLARGVNSIQAVKTSAGWRVLEVSWQAEEKDLKLTTELLPE